MQTEFINTRIVSRKKLVLKMTGALLGFLFLLFCQYYFASDSEKLGLSSSRNSLSWNQYVFFSCLAVVVIVPFMFWSRILLRISVSVEENKLTIELIEKWRWNRSTKTVKLSQTQIQTEHVKETNYWLLRKSPEYHTLHLINPEFGTLSVTQQDFDNLKEIVQYFEDVKLDAARKIRQKRKAGQ